ncbi:MAG TPA: hypothetical protein VNX46_07760 [Candidatus Acidoferrum sp.]|nr:hypothetical protein [Candidatus Acidoferrum sp.]
MKVRSGSNSRRLHRSGTFVSDIARRCTSLLVSIAFLLAPVLPAAFPSIAQAHPAPTPPAAPAGTAGCSLQSANGQIQHIVYIQFDNVHFTRDNPNVPSDLEQMPNLLNFFETNGTLLTDHHTPLISHTADDIITSLTGVYLERHGLAVSNSYNYFNPNSADGLGSTFTTAFTYWTDVVDPNTPSADPSFNLLTPDGKNAPAPWVPFTRAGCNVGAVSIANMELENTHNDITTVFGAGSPEQIEANGPGGTAKATADFVGVAIHCAAGNSVCNTANAKADVLPDEPGGYSGYSALYGHKYVVPVIAPGGLNDLAGNPITGFPGFGGISAAQTLAYVAAMQENGVPITYAYISDAHDRHSFPFRAFGPGEQGYVQQLQAYDAAFGTFFARLATDGITAANTLFIVTADEGDHFAGGTPINPSCNGSTGNFCTYNLNNNSPNQNSVGEIDANIQSLLGEVDPSLNFTNTPFDIHFDMAPAFYISGQPATGSPIARQFEQDAAKLTALNPITGNTDQLTRGLVDPVGMKFLHMITGDPLRTPTFIMFGDPDYFFQTFGADVAVNDGFAWNHGGIDPKINTTFLGIVGPGVKAQGVQNAPFTDHTDIRPTILSLVGLTDDYQSQGRTIAEVLTDGGKSAGIAASGDWFTALASAYKRINAPTGDVGLAVIRASTTALAGDFGTYNSLEARIDALTSRRDAVSARMAAMLNAAEFQGHAISKSEAFPLIVEAGNIADYAAHLAGQ